MAEVQAGRGRRMSQPISRETEPQSVERRSNTTSLSLDPGAISGLLAHPGNRKAHGSAWIADFRRKRMEADDQRGVVETSPEAQIPGIPNARAKSRFGRVDPD